MDDIRLAFRRVLNRPAASIVAVLTLAFGIGAAAATWSLLSAVLLHPLPVRDPETLVVMGQIFTRQGQPDSTYNAFVYPYYEHFQNSGVFERVAAQWSGSQSMLVSTGGSPVQTRVGFATYDFFDVLGVRIPVGRDFLETDDSRGAEPVAILTDRYWRQAFSGNAAVIGRTIEVAGKRASIVGIAAPHFRGLDLSEAPDLYLPFHTIAAVGSPVTNYFADPNQRASPTAGTMIIGRLRAVDSVERASARLSALIPPAGLKSEAKIVLTSVTDAAIPAAARAGMSRFARLMAVTVGLLLMIGCMSVGMLLLIRTEARREEFGICLALGASRSRLAKGVAIEGGLLAVAGAVLAMPVAWWLFWGVRAFQLPGNVSIELLELTLDGRALTASIAGALSAIFIITVVAAFGFSIDVADVMRSRSGSTPRLRQRRTRRVLAVGQVAVALVLLSGAGLFTRSIMEALSLNSYLEMDSIVTGNISLGPYDYNGPNATVFFDDLFAGLSTNPTVRSVAYSIPQGGMTPAGKIVIDAVPRQFPSVVLYTTVDQHYFRTMGIPLLRGRDFSAEDGLVAPRVVIVSESFGRLIADGKDPLRRRITASSNRPGQPPDVMEVVGVVGDVVINVSALEPLVMYFPMAQADPRTNPVLNRSLAVRIAGDPDTARREIHSAIRQIDSSVAPSPLLTLEERIGAQMSSQRFGAYIMGVLGAIAILLTLLGIYVLAESMAVLRMREMGIRAALGATQSQLAGIVLAETFRQAVIGLAVGLLLTWTGANTIRAFLFRVQPFDPQTLATMCILILILALMVSLRSAVRAARVDIAQVLNEE